MAKVVVQLAVNLLRRRAPPPVVPVGRVQLFKHGRVGVPKIVLGLWVPDLLDMPRELRKDVSAP